MPDEIENEDVNASGGEENDGVGEEAHDAGFDVEEVHFDDGPVEDDGERGDAEWADPDELVVAEAGEDEVEGAADGADGGPGEDEDDGAFAFDAAGGFLDRVLEKSNDAGAEVGDGEELINDVEAGGV